MLSVTPNAVLNPTFADSHFVDQPVWSGLLSPASVRFASDGRAFVAQKNGVVKEFDSLADQTPTWVIDLQTQVDNYWDRGLLSIALDPNFLNGSPYIYLYIVYDAPLFPTGALSTTAPVWNDACPDPPAPTYDGCVVSSEVLRIQVDPATNVAVGGIYAQPQILVHDWCQQFPSHAGGAMVFDGSGNLVVTGGDGASFSGVDYGQLGGTRPNTTSPVVPMNPCNDPETVTGSNPGTVTVATAEGGSLRSQQVRINDLRPGMHTSLDGSVIRIDPLTGNGVATNPLASSTDPNNQRIIAHGFRNPFRMTSRPGTDELYVGDVGDQTWEEIDLINPPSQPATTTTLANYGWPCYEGPAQSGWSSLGFNVCTNLYAQSNAVTSPVYAYAHCNSNTGDGSCHPNVTNAGGLCYPNGASKVSSSISGLAFYEGASGTSVTYGSASATNYNGALFFTDYSRNCLGVLFPDGNGRPNPATVQQVASNLSHPVDLVAGAGGDLFYVDMDAGVIHRISYHLDPVAQATATPSALLAPGIVHLDGTASTTPDPQDAIAQYNWFLNNQGVTGNPDATGATVDWQFTTQQVYNVVLQVVTTNNRTATTTIQVDATHAPPVPTIDTPLSSLTWTVGDTINFSGHAVDGTGTPIAAGHLDWALVMHHCPAGCHEHFVQTWTGAASGSFSAPDHEYPSYLELRLTATDSAGVSATTSVLLYPKTATLTVRSSVPGVQLNVDTIDVPSPTTLTFIKGGAATVSAPSSFSAGGQAYHFVTWSDSVNALHNVTVAADMTITAVYHPDACEAVAANSAQSSWISDYLGGTDDGNWFRFALTSQRRVVITAGRLPVDAKLELLVACGSVLATSDHAGTRFEQLIKVLPAGTYRVHVLANSGAASSTPYTLRFWPLATGVPVLSSVATRSGSTVTVAGEALNNTGATTGKITVTATFINGTKTVATLKGTAFVYRLSSGAITPFRLSGTVPTYTSVKLATAWATPVAGPKLVVTGVVYAAGPNGTTLEKVTVKNTGTTTAKSPAVARTWYGTRGEVVGVGLASGSTSLAPGKSATYIVTRPATLSTILASATAWRAIL